MRKTFFIVLVCVFFNLPSWASPPTLKVLTTSSFAKDMGRSIQTEFLKQYHCEIRFILVDSVQHLLAIIERAKNPGDVVLGFAHESFGAPAVRKSLIDLPPFPYISSEKASMKPSNPPYTDISTPTWQDTKLWPLSYYILGFIYDATKVPTPPQSFEALCSGPHKIILVDPRTSRTGLALMMWIQKIFGHKTGSFLRRLKPHILTIAPNWAQAYSLFLRGEVPMVLGYTASPAYHRLMEQKNNIRSATFKEGHYLEYNTVGVLNTTHKKDLAMKLIHMLLSPAFQHKFVYENWAYPVRPLSTPLPTEFTTPRIIIAPYTPQEVFTHKEEWLDTWLKSLA